MPKTITVAAEAMATRFEVALHGASEATLRAAAEEALAEIGRLEAMLSLYQPTSEMMLFDFVEKIQTNMPNIVYV